MPEKTGAWEPPRSLRSLGAERGNAHPCSCRSLVPGPRSRSGPVASSLSSESRITNHDSRLEGWLFDVYPSHDGMIVWIIDDRGRAHRLRYRYTPTCYAAGGRSALEAARQALARLRTPVTLTPTVRRGVISGTQIPGLAGGGRKTPGLPPPPPPPGPRARPNPFN